MIDIDPTLPPVHDDDLLAGEYVLGVLEAADRREAATRIARDPGFAARVARWEAHLAPWLLRGEPVAPGAQVWPRIRRELGWPAVESAARRGLWHSAGFWRAATAVALAASVFAVVIGLRPQQAPVEVPPPIVQAPPPPAQEEAAALPVTVLAQDDGKTGWIARVAPDRSKVLMVPVPRPTDAGGKVNELWIIAANKAPLSLGFVSNDRAHSIEIPAAIQAEFATGATLAVTLEPEAGIPHAAPTGPIVAKGVIAAI
jgi:anti-sigma-K factor RskA